MSDSIELKCKQKWKCGWCDKLYSFTELLELYKVQLVEEDTDPDTQHGYTVRCECGYKFLTDRWKLQDNIVISIDNKDIEIMISTVYLELNHGYTKDLWYETMIFIDNPDVDCQLQRRYETKDEAINDHNKILNMIKEKLYTIDEDEDKKILNLNLLFDED